jgi:hypothetical protein
MRKFKISIATLFFYFVGYSQQKKSDSVYENRPLKLEEVDFVSGYFNQNGNHSAVSGGNGSEKLSDISNNLNITLVKASGKYEHTFDLGLTAEHHTSASTAYIETSPTGFTTTPYSKAGISTKSPNTSTTSRSSYSGNSDGTSAVSSASTLYGWRFNPSLVWHVKNLENNTTFGLGAYYSYEFDYNSLGAEVSFAKASMDNNSEFSIKGIAFFDHRQYIIPIELRASNPNYGDWRAKNSYSTNLSFSQVINSRFQIAVLADFAYQKGLLSTPYNRVYFQNNTVNNEQLPDSRLKIPLGIRANYFVGNSVILRGYYRYYWDNWGITSNTASLEIPIKINPNLSISPFERYHQQNGTRYFAAFAQQVVGADFYSSDYDLSSFTSNNAGVNVHVVPQNWGFIHDLDFRYSHYKRSDGLSGNNFTLAFTFK